MAGEQVSNDKGVKAEERFTEGRKKGHRRKKLRQVLRKELRGRAEKKKVKIKDKKGKLQAEGKEAKDSILD